MTNPRRRRIQRVAHTVALVALVTNTVMGAAVVMGVPAAVYTEARCRCGRLIMAVPGRVAVEVRMVRTNYERTGRGRVVACPRGCGLCEVVEHHP